MNAWSLLYDVMSDGNWVKENGGYEYTPPTPYDDGWTAKFKEEQNQITLNIDNNNGYWKYSEDVILNELRDYLSGTYRAHYANDNKTQTLDLIDSIGDSEAFCRSNAIKYLSRFGKKDGKSKLDILKAIHYCVLLYHFSGLTKKPQDNYETF